MFDLFPRPPSLSPLRRAIHTGGAILGTVILFITVFIIALEIVTTPGVRPWSVRITLLAAATSLVHVLWEARSTGPMSFWKWSSFTVSLCVFATELWMTVRDPTARAVFLGVLVAGAVLILAARLAVAALPPAATGRTRG